MSKKHEYSEECWGQIIGAHQCGKSIREIAAILKISKSTVRYNIKKWKLNGNVKSCPKNGRPCILSSKNERKILQIVEVQPTLSAKSL